LKSFGLSANERIKSRRDFERIYNFGKTIFSTDRKVKAVFLSEKNPERPGVKIAAAVHKKSGIAVWRNRAKRLIKEAYRLNKNVLIDHCLSKKVLLKVVFSPAALNERRNKKIILNDFMPGIVEIMLKLKNSV
jgi:ribonuclease P protein component